MNYITNFNDTEVIFTLNPVANLWDTPIIQITFQGYDANMVNISNVILTFGKSESRSICNTQALVRILTGILPHVHRKLVSNQPVLHTSNCLSY